MRKSIFTLISLVIAFSMLLTACQSAAPAAQPTTATEATKAPVATTAPPTSGDKVTITWYIGLGAGANPEQIALEEAFVEKFNASHPNINLETIIVPNAQAQSQLATMIAGGNSPDIIGPVGVGGRASFTNQLLDLSPLILSENVDLSVYEKALVDFYNIPGVGQVGLPFGVYPMVVFYNQAMFDEAGLPYPPKNYGEKYDGKEWTFDTFTELAKKLTVDSNGKDATQDGFDKTKVVQWGMNYQWGTNVANLGATWGNGSIVADDKKTAQIPEVWKEGLQWYYDAMFKDGIAINATQEAAQEIGGNAFSAGKVAMTITNSWYLCCIDQKKVEKFNFSPMPSNDGVIVSVLDADTFNILKGSKHPKEAFTVLQYFLTEGAPDLYAIYGPLPGLTANQAAFFKSQNEKWKLDLNWPVVVESMKYPDVPSTEQELPNNLESAQVIGDFNTKLFSTPGLDLNSEYPAFLELLQASFDKAK